MSETKSDLLSLTINGKEVKAAAGTTLLMAARSAEIEIPTLCHHDELADFGACRLCVVEIEKGGWKKIVVSCLYPVEEGISVETESEKVIQHRRTILEFLAARWPNISPELLKRYEVPTGRMEENTNFCIMCGLCVRHCSEKKGANVLGFVGRGIGRQVVLYPELAKVHCPTCGDKTTECFDICPTGVINNDFAKVQPYLWPKDKVIYPVRVLDDENSQKVNKMAGGKVG
jgi:bidirectional [NiFe] hydrogenase diaphorase subunit